MAEMRPRLILASASSRRAEILSRAGIPFQVRVAEVAEQQLAGEDAEAYARRLAMAKAEAVPAAEDEIVLGADTVVVTGGPDGQILEKPADPEDAGRMLRLLAGRDHQVITAICLRAGARRIVDAETSTVHFLPLSASEIDSYVASGEPLDKAGAYGIQGLASKFIHRVEGCYFNVVGLPISLVWRHLRRLGFPVSG